MTTEIIDLLNQTYDLKDQNKEEYEKIKKLKHKINKHNGQIILRVKKINIIESNIRKIIRGE